MGGMAQQTSSNITTEEGKEEDGAEIQTKEDEETEANKIKI